MSDFFDFPITYLDSNDGSSMLAFGLQEFILIKENNALECLDDFIIIHSTKYIFGALNYNLKNEIEDLQTLKHNDAEFPQLLFYVPSCVVKLAGEKIEFLQGEKDDKNLNFIHNFLTKKKRANPTNLKIGWRKRTNKEKYIENIYRIKDFIRQGEVYEMNYCQEFYAENSEIQDPLEFFFKLNEVTKSPFSVYFQFDEYFLLCGSPERFLKMKGRKLLSQPIKGTRRRDKDKYLDGQLKKELKDNLKERAENIMIVDLVRNDLSKVATKNSVSVDELCEIYSFETVHQMISTISCKVKNSISFTDIIKATFPMGSMTGAPKLRTMELIDYLEDFSRGIYSGSIGYLAPNGDFDFNVVIRSIVYNSKKKYISCPVGSAITLDSDPEKEYEECQTKISRILNVQ